METKSINQRATEALTAYIRELRQQAKSLEDSRPYTASEAVEKVNRAKALREKASWLENDSGTRSQWLAMKQEEIALKDRQDARAGIEAFSAMQRQFMAIETARNEQITDIMNNLTYNGALGIDRMTLRRQIDRLVSGEGTFDAAGNRYVRFSEASSTATYRAVVTPAGAYGFILEARDGGAGEMGQ